MHTPLKEKFRVRFAPSPTGSIHPGTGSLVFWNKVFALKNQGEIIVGQFDLDYDILV